MIALFNTFVHTPLYNALIFLVGVMPGHSMGLAIIVLTLLVRVVLYPVSRQASATQAAMREIAPKIEELKEKHKDQRDEQARAIFALYKEHKIRPFSSFLLILVQLPVLIGLYLVFFRGGLPVINPSLLYSFIPVPDSVNMIFLGVLDLSERSIFLAALAGATQLVYARLTMSPPKPASGERSFSADLARSMDLQMRYVLPLMLGVFAYIASSAVALYFITGNLFMIGQEYLARRRFRDMKGQ